MIGRRQSIAAEDDSVGQKTWADSVSWPRLPKSYSNAVSSGDTFSCLGSDQELEFRGGCDQPMHRTC